MPQQTHRQPQREQSKQGRDSGAQRGKPLPDDRSPEDDAQSAPQQHPDRMHTGKPGQRNARDQRAGNDDAGQPSMGQDDGLPLPHSPDDDDDMLGGAHRAARSRKQCCTGTRVSAARTSLPLA